MNCWLLDDLDEPILEQKNDEEPAASEETDDPLPIVPKLRKRAFSIQEKLRILEFSENSSIHEASKRFKVDRSTVRGWKKKQNELRF
jgi:hypothetical protein